MPNQWENLFKNEGTWKGSFTKLTPDGTEVSNVPSILTLERTSETSARFQVTRYPTGQPPQETKTEFASINQSSLFCEDGSFTKGSTQWSPFSQFGTEFGLTLPNARFRLVQLFNPGGALADIILIRETREGQADRIRAPLSMDQLVGTWRGQAIVYRRDWSVSQPFTTELNVSKQSADTVLQTWRAGPATGQSIAKVQGSRLLFETGYQLLCLPNGGSSLCPQTIQRNTAFRCEVGWLIEPNIRLRLTREYEADGSWGQQTWIREEKIA
ncbi:DUF3598 family protein [Leptothoe kymatousa]|uniref:DUF3598 family protein n=1 Tax=Leptothoe kymatousa TAU-MAC 1615 TaxID=2364775 RepID=A0ABS5Y9I1_9CYAN|nr:DUF3598 family protein [Leptothoe kymatousa]MBT9313615.1 DUF3598 family protein [Leptothoe kymatousa TAU-MAC 1615]